MYVIGIENTGGLNCYQNAVFQCLCRIPRVKEFFTSCKDVDGVFSNHFKVITHALAMPKSQAAINLKSLKVSSCPYFINQMFFLLFHACAYFTNRSWFLESLQCLKPFDFMLTEKKDNFQF